MNVKNPTPSAYMSHLAMCDLVGAQTARESMTRGTVLCVPSSRDRLGPVTITNLDSWRWNRWNRRWERLDNWNDRATGAMGARLIEGAT